MDGRIMGENHEDIILPAMILPAMILPLLCLPVEFIERGL